MRAIRDAGEADPSLRTFARELRLRERDRFAAAIVRAREARGIGNPILDATTAAWVAVVLRWDSVGAAEGEAPRTASEIARLVRIVTFTEARLA